MSFCTTDPDDNLRVTPDALTSNDILLQDSVAMAVRTVPFAGGF